MDDNIPNPLPTRLGKEELYDFDTRGFILKEGFVKPEETDGILAALEPLWQQEGGSGLLFRAPVFDTDLPFFRNMALRVAAESGVYDTINQPFRLIESYALRRAGGSLQALHNGRSNKNESAFGASNRTMWRDHTYHDGLLHCMMVKALVYLSDVTALEDGPFVVVEGSHKANFPFPIPLSHMKKGAGLDRPGTSPVYARAGDLLLLNEALTHGSLPKTSPGDRTFIAFSFAPSFVSNYRKLAKGSHSLSEMGFRE
ncbi:phytanoyl-CoA dioxygenase family protein [Streptomyces hygroscopicus]|uniref:phytanoyl-CoA dioxygenase family protein n=1 Tax=Streptomyces hygroscopicus TaxID=1912 RepID=UPI00363F0827